LGGLSGVRGLTEGGGAPDPAGGGVGGRDVETPGVEDEEVMLNQ